VPGVLTAGVILHGRYEIKELVAEGGMGAVYRADDLRLTGRQVAIKEVAYQKQGATDIEEARQQFYREASTLARLDHPNLPKVSDHFSENENDYLVMDFVPGPDLQAIVEQATAEGRHLPESQVLEWASQLCNALQYLHSQEPPVLHRDIKPANIRLASSGMVKLVDFGLVKLMTPDEARTVTVIHGRGTVCYTPLEQYGGETGHTDTRADIYGLGATLYHLLTGEQPPSAKDRYLQPGILTPPQEINPTMSERMNKCILWAMQLHPDNRPSSVVDFRDALFGRAPIPALNASLSAAAGATSGKETWSHAIRANLGLVLLAVALLAIAVYISNWPLSLTPPAFP